MNRPAQRRTTTQNQLDFFARLDAPVAVPVTVASGYPAELLATSPGGRALDRVSLPLGMSKDWPLVISYGMGWDSTAMLVLLKNSGIVPSLILFADTGSERPTTYAYLEVINEWLRRVGFPEVTVVRYKGKGTTYETLYDNCVQMKMLPSLAYGGHKHGCSLKFKVGPMDKYVSKWPPARLVWSRGGRVVRVIGYDDSSADNKRRIRFEDRGGEADDGKFVYWYALQDAGWDRAECGRRIVAEGLPLPPKSACFFCLTGETEVVTRDGVKPIRELAGGRHRLLVPQMGTKGGLSHRGSFQEVEVRAFGRQKVWEISLRKGSATRVVRATAEHRWFLAAPAGAQWEPMANYERTTQTLKAGDHLRSLRATAPAREEIMHVAVAQGFVYGDGTRQSDREGPASVVFYNPAKDGVMLPFFGGAKVSSVTVKGVSCPHIYGLPRFWKDAPPLSESRSFLLSWLAGYFAADGSVAGAQPVLESASLESLEIARSVAAICGVGYSAIRSRMRVGFEGREPSALYRMSLRAADLPEWFFLIEHHRAHARPVKRVDRLWVVESVWETEAVEDVFCAVVPGAQAFGLSEDLMTGNCPSSKPHEMIELAIEHPDLAMRVIELERIAGPRLEMIDGLWGAGSKATKGGVPKPGSMTEFLLVWMVDGRAYERLPQLGDPGTVPLEIATMPNVSKVYRRLSVLDADAEHVMGLRRVATDAAIALRREFEARHGAGSVEAMLAAGQARREARGRLARGRILAVRILSKRRTLAALATARSPKDDRKYLRTLESLHDDEAQVAPFVAEFGEARLFRKGD